MKLSLFKHAALLGALFVAVASCSVVYQPPRTQPFQKNMSFKAEPDAVWEALMEVFADNAWPVVAVDKAAGLISSDLLILEGPAVNYSDCGFAKRSVMFFWTRKEDPPEKRFFNHRMRLNVLVAQNGEETMVRPTTYFTAQRRDKPEIDLKCVSLGILEDYIFDSLKFKLQE